MGMSYRAIEGLSLIYMHGVVHLYIDNRAYRQTKKYAYINNQSHRGFSLFVPAAR